MSEKNSQILRGLVAIVILVVIVGGVVFVTNEDESEETASTNQTTSQSANQSAQTTTTTQEQAQQPTSNSSTQNSTQEYSDGTYSASGSYSSPGGNESISIEVTIANDEVADVTVTQEATNPTSERYQDDFAENILSLVLGVNLDEANVSNVAGSSLTSRGFNEALDEIRAEAAI